MAWTVSATFEEWHLGLAKNTATGFGGLTTDTINVALFNNSSTPDKNAAVGLTGYGAASSAWVSANGVSDSNWPAVGRPLASVTATASGGTVTYDAADTTGAGNVTLSNAYGCLVYDNAITGGTVSKQGVCFNYFGGAQSVSAGTFTVVWNASGIFTITV